MARRRIVITGGTDGIGLELARRLAGRHDVMVTGRRSGKLAAALLPPSVHYVQADQEQPEQAATDLARGLLKAGWTRLDHAVLNAATGHACAPAAETPALIAETLAVNLLAPVLQARVLRPALKRTGGTLTFVGSVARNGAPQFATYAASKAALHGLARALRSEWQDEIAVQVIHPGPTRTAMHAKAGHDPGRAGRLFLDAADMAAMMEHAIASRRSPQTLGWLRYLSGGAWMGPRL